MMETINKAIEMMFAKAKEEDENFDGGLYLYLSKARNEKV